MKNGYRGFIGGHNDRCDPIAKRLSKTDAGSGPFHYRTSGAFKYFGMVRKEKILTNFLKKFLISFQILWKIFFSFRHYVITGPPDTPYHDGLYHGKLVFPPDYPFKPPSIYMLTPNGRFKPNTRSKKSSFHSLFRELINYLIK